MGRSIDTALGAANLFPGDVIDLEKRRLSLSSRILLLGYYWTRRNRGLRFRRKLEEHVLWFVRNKPGHELFDSEILRLAPQSDGDLVFDSAREIWLEHLNKKPGDTRLLRHAAAFFASSDPERALNLLQEGKALEPDNPYWPDRIAALFEDAFSGPAAGDSEVVTAILKNELEELCRLARPANRALCLARLARRQLNRVRDLTGASSTAERLLEEFGKGRRASRTQFAVQTARAILGRICLKNWDIAGARHHFGLALSASKDNVLVSAELRNLICELIEAGETALVNAAISSKHSAMHTCDWSLAWCRGIQIRGFHRYSIDVHAFAPLDLKFSRLPHYEINMDLKQYFDTGDLGSPFEALAALSSSQEDLHLDIWRKLVAALRYGDDTEHGVLSLLSEVPEQTGAAAIEKARRSSVILQQGGFCLVNSVSEYADDKGTHLLATMLYRELPFETALNICWWYVFVWRQRIYRSIKIVGVDFEGRRNFFAIAGA
ncbi:MAG: hypothetical protein KC777_23935 [Cyanobacteria bacterium HKST-UBA02]|nr:hypothetical protein [Cyanobacteria bacterium HKST-UBA02]